MAAWVYQTVPVPASTSGGPASDGKGAAVGVSGAEKKWVVLTGTWTGPAEVDVEITFDGSSWFVANTNVDGLTGDTANPIEITQGALAVRCSTNAGTPAVTCQLATWEHGASPPPPPTG